MFHDFCQSVTLVFCQRTHVSHDHHPRGSCCSRARISYDEPCMGAIFYQKIFASALINPSLQQMHGLLEGTVSDRKLCRGMSGRLCPKQSEILEQIRKSPPITQHNPEG